MITDMGHEKIAYRQEEYEKVRYEAELAIKKIGYNVKNCHFIPVCLEKGINITSNKTSHMFWYKGLKLYEALESLNKTPRWTDKALRLPVYSIDMIKGVGLVVSGRVEFGKLSK